jgi:hypothetical protein
VLDLRHAQAAVKVCCCRARMLLHTPAALEQAVR